MLQSNTFKGHIYKFLAKDPQSQNEYNQSHHRLFFASKYYTKKYSEDIPTEYICCGIKKYLHNFGAQKDFNIFENCMECK